MSNDFIPLNQSTPVQVRWQGKNHNYNNSGYQNNWQQQNQRRRGQHKRWTNHSQHSSNSFGSDNSSYGHDSKANIDAYLHPSMLKDPWEHLTTQKKLQDS